MARLAAAYRDEPMLFILLAGLLEPRTFRPMIIPDHCGDSSQSTTIRETNEGSIPGLVAGSTFFGAARQLLPIASFPRIYEGLKRSQLQILSRTTLGDVFGHDCLLELEWVRCTGLRSGACSLIAQRLPTGLQKVVRQPLVAGSTR